MNKLLSVCFMAVHLCLCVCFAFAQSQSFSQGQPPSHSIAMPAPSTATLPALDNRAFLQEDEANYSLALAQGIVPPAQIARNQEVNFNLNNSGTWETLPNGDRVWRLRIVSPNATDLYIIYDQWRIVKPCELFVYNDDRSMTLGPYTSIDNWDGTNVTPITSGSAVTLEYHVPADQQDIGELSIMRVLHGYRHFFNREAREQDALDNFGDAIACHLNALCFPDWQQDKLSVALIFDPMGGACSGTMINNVAQDGAPNFLTANHCLGTNWTNWLLYFNYESPACNPTSDGDYGNVITNASLLSNATVPGSDFALLRLSRNRPDSPFIPRFQGWDRNNIAATSTAGIHHPAADVKKTHLDFDPVDVHPAETHWRTHIDLGMMEPGSSGSALFNQDHRIVGQLQGGNWDCDVNTINDADYGKFSYSWGAGADPSTRLRDHLDPTNTGVWTVDSWQPTGPPNDSCGQPGVPLITTVPYNTSGSTQWAASNAQSSSSPDVVYTMQFPCDYNITVSTCGGASFDTEITVYRTTPDCDGSGAYEGSNDDFCGTRSQFSFTAIAGHVYSVWIDGYASAWGTFNFSVTGGPVATQPTGLCPGTTIDTVPYFTFTDNYCAQNDIALSCRPNGGNDVVYNWVSPYTQQMRAKTCNTNFDTVLEVLQGGTCVNGFSVGCNDDACDGSGLGSSVSFFATAGATYFFHIDGYNGAEGTTSFQLEVANDDCSSPFVLTDVPTFSVGDTRPARDDFATVVGPASKEVFFQYTSPSCQNLSFSTCGLNGFDTGVEVRTGGPCPGSTLVGYSDDACGTQSRVSWGADATRTYYIIVGGYNTNEGPFWFNFENAQSAQPHTGDICQTSLQIPSLPFTDFGNTCCMADNYASCAGPDSREVVYQFSTETCQEVTVSLCGSNYDTGLGIYGGTCPNIAPLIVCNDDSDCGGIFTVQSNATFTAEPFTNYQILVHGYFAYCGNFVLNVTGAPCVIPTPDPVNDLVIRAADPTGNDVHLFWSATANASEYDIYYSIDQNDIFNPANVIFSTAGTDGIVADVLSNGEAKGFFGVIAVGANVLAANANELRPKDEAVNSVAMQNPAFLLNNENVELASPGK